MIDGRVEIPSIRQRVLSSTLRYNGGRMLPQSPPVIPRPGPGHRSVALVQQKVQQQPITTAYTIFQKHTSRRTRGDERPGVPVVRDERGHCPHFRIGFLDQERWHGSAAAAQNRRSGYAAWAPVPARRLGRPPRRTRCQLSPSRKPAGQLAALALRVPSALDGSPAPAAMSADLYASGASASGDGHHHHIHQEIGS